MDSTMLADEKIYKSRLYGMTQVTETYVWNDSAVFEELKYVIEHGGVGAT